MNPQLQVIATIRIPEDVTSLLTTTHTFCYAVPDLETPITCTLEVPPAGEVWTLVCSLPFIFKKTEKIGKQLTKVCIPYDDGTMSIRKQFYQYIFCGVK